MSEMRRRARAARLMRDLTTAKDGRTPSVIRFWGLCFAVIDIGMSISFLAMAWMAAAGRVSMSFDLMSAAQGFGILMAAHWAGLAGFAAALKWQLHATAGNDFGGGYYGQTQGWGAGGDGPAGGGVDGAAWGPFDPRV